MESDETFARQAQGRIGCVIEDMTEAFISESRGS